MESIILEASFCTITSHCLFAHNSCSCYNLNASYLLFSVLNFNACFSCCLSGCQITQKQYRQMRARGKVSYCCWYTACCWQTFKKQLSEMKARGTEEACVWRNDAKRMLSRKKKKKQKRWCEKKSGCFKHSCWSQDNNNNLLSWDNFWNSWPESPQRICYEYATIAHGT